MFSSSTSKKYYFLELKRFFGHSFYVEFCVLSIYEVFRAIPALSQEQPRFEQKTPPKQPFFWKPPHMEGKKRPPWILAKSKAGGGRFDFRDFLWNFQEKNMFFRYPVLLSRKKHFLWKIEKWWKSKRPPLRLKANLEIFDIYQNYKTLIFMFFSFFPRKFILWTAYFTFPLFENYIFTPPCIPKVI